MPSELSPQTVEELRLKEKQTPFETEELLLFERSQTLKDREWHNQLQLKKLEFEREQRTQFELKKLEFARESERERREYEMRKLELELEAKKVEASRSVQLMQSFDVGWNIKIHFVSGM